MSLYSFMLFSILIMGLHGQTSPPHCTVVTKNTDYPAKYRFDYPTVYLIPGQKEAYQQMYCLNPSVVNLGYTRVCDWYAPPQVAFTIGDEHVYIKRQDPTGRFTGNAVVSTYQLCGHNRTYLETMLETNEVSHTPFLITELH